MSAYRTRAAGPFATPICQFIASQFPRGQFTPKGQIIDLLTEEFLGTKQNRYGPRPSPESIVKIRDTLRHYVAEHRPIPIAVPWGSEKPDGSSIDIAELMALRQLADLHARIQAHYVPGVQINVRIEDASASHLFHWRPEDAAREAARYTADMKGLVQVLGLPINLRPESDKISWKEFSAEADLRLTDFERALMLEETRIIEEKWGWRGGFNSAMVDYYINSYKKLYPNNTHSDNMKLLARYFAGASTRSALGLRGDDPEWEGNYLELSFVAPIPGTDERFMKRVHYRTLPLVYTSNHIPPWRAKGYLQITNDDQITPKLGVFGQVEGLEEEGVIIEGEGTWVEVRADYQQV